MVQTFTIEMDEDSIEYTAGDEPLRITFNVSSDPPLTSDDISVSIECSEKLPDGSVTLLDDGMIEIYIDDGFEAQIQPYYFTVVV